MSTSQLRRQTIFVAVGSAGVGLSCAFKLIVRVVSVLLNQERGLGQDRQHACPCQLRATRRLRALSAAGAEIRASCPAADLPRAAARHYATNRTTSAPSRPTPPPPHP